MVPPPLYCLFSLHLRQYAVGVAGGRRTWGAWGPIRTRGKKKKKEINEKSIKEKNVPLLCFRLTHHRDRGSFRFEPRCRDATNKCMGQEDGARDLRWSSGGGRFASSHPLPHPLCAYKPSTQPPSFVDYAAILFFVLAWPHPVLFFSPPTNLQGDIASFPPG